MSLPAFFPDATHAVVRAVDAHDVSQAGVAGVYVNTLHLADRPGLSAVEALGGVHRFMGWSRPIISDSGGFQVYSLMARSKSLGTVSVDGFHYRFRPGEKKKLLSPEKSIEDQFRLGADCMICLDQCTHPQASGEVQRESVTNTLAWAKRSKDTFLRCLDRFPPRTSRPLLFAVVQGGKDPELRRRCASELREIGFDGYGYGGWPVDSRGALQDMVGYTTRWLPAELPRLALGIGEPANVVAACRLGYTMFDCTLPTRDARHKRLYVFERPPGARSLEGHFYSYVHIEREQYVRDLKPLDEHCDCACCQSYSRAYLHHLFVVNDTLAGRLATIHNLRFYTRFFELLRAG